MKTIFAHWQRGVLIMFCLSLLFMGAAVLAAMLVGIVFVVLEVLVLPSNKVGSFEDAYVTLSMAAVLIVIAPYTLSTAWESLAGVVSKSPG